MKQNVIDEYVPLVKSIASKYKDFGVPFEDLVQEGMLGILEARKRFDPKRDTKFSTYATYWIRKKILTTLKIEMKQSLNALYLDGNIKVMQEANTEPKDYHKISLPENFPALEKKILTLYFQEGKTIKEISKILNIPCERIRQLMKKALRRLKINRNLTKPL